MSLAEKERKELVKYRLEKASSTLAEVPVLVEKKFYRTAANRLYYACYYAATALLVNDGYETHTHNGVKTLLGLHYVKDGCLKKSLGKVYGKLFNLRQTGDYEDWIDIEEEDVAPLVEPAEKFIAEVEGLVRKREP